MYGHELWTIRVSAKAGLWTLDWTMDWTLDWNMDSILDSFSLVRACTRSSVGARNNTGEPTAAAGRPRRQLSITKCLNFKHLVMFKHLVIK